MLYAEIDLKPKYRCNVCGRLLWQRKIRGRRYLYTEDGKRHYRYCNMRPVGGADVVAAADEEAPAEGRG